MMMNNQSRHGCFTKPKIICVLRHFYDFEMPAADSFFTPFVVLNSNQKTQRDHYMGTLTFAGTCFHSFLTVVLLICFWKTSVLFVAAGLQFV